MPRSTRPALEPAIHPLLAAAEFAELLNMVRHAGGRTSDLIEIWLSATDHGLPRTLPGRTIARPLCLIRARSVVAVTAALSRLHPGIDVALSAVGIARVGIVEGDRHVDIVLDNRVRDGSLAVLDEAGAVSCALYGLDAMRADFDRLHAGTVGEAA